MVRCLERLSLKTPNRLYSMEIISDHVLASFSGPVKCKSVWNKLFGR
jgi:hypothetical protein